MKTKFTFIWITLLTLTYACSPIQASDTPSNSQNSDIPTTSESSQEEAPLPIIETTIPQSSAITPIVSTAIAASTLESLPLQSTTETPLPGGNPIPEAGITLQDGDKTFKMKVGDSFLLNLGSDIYDWTVSVDNENVLRMKVGIMVIKGAQGIYEALAPGTANLQAAGNPTCLQSRPACAMPSILFRVTIIVE
jgi:hypothetical protein